MPIETRAAIRFREAEERSFSIVSRLVRNIQRASCRRCEDDYVKLMELYDGACNTSVYRLLYETYMWTDLYVIAKCAEYLGAWSVYENIRCGNDHLFTILDVARYDVFWRQICAELDITFVHSKN
jgi:hypothetical protein